MQVRFIPKMCLFDIKVTFFSYFVEKRDKNPTLNIRINMFYSSKHFLLPHDEDQQNINWEMEANVLQ